MEGEHHCESCGATLAPDSAACRICGRPAPAGTPRGAVAAGRPTFRPAPRIPAPLKAARPPRGFTPVAGRLANGGGARATDDAVLELTQVEDVTPIWVYWLVFGLSIIGVLWAYLFWASGSPIITPIWRTLFLALMVVYIITGTFVGVRLTRRQRYHERARLAAIRAAHGSRAFARRQKEGVVRAVHGAKAGVTGAGKSIRASGTHFREGFHAEKEPNFIIRMIRGFVRAGVWVYLKVVRLVKAVLSLVLFLLRIVLWFYVKLVQLGWVLYRGIVEPVVILAFRIVRWALGVVYRPVRWVLRTAWRLFYWIVRIWPISYATRALEVPTRVHVAPFVLSTDVIVSDALHVPVRPDVLEAAGASVEAFRLRFRMRRAIRLLPLYEEREVERPERVRVPRPEERRAAAVERRLRRKEERERRKREEQEEEQARKDAIERQKEREKERKLAVKAAKAETKERLAREKAAGRNLSKEEREAIEAEIMRRHLGEEAEEPVAAAPVAPVAEVEDEKAAKAEEKRRAQEEKQRRKAEAARAKEERKKEREAEKKERQARKEAEKEVEPILKARLAKAKKEGRKLDKEQKAQLRDEIIESLVAKKLGRPASEPAAPKPEPAPEPAPTEEKGAGEAPAKKKRGFSLKRRRGEEEEATPRKSE